MLAERWVHYDQTIGFSYNYSVHSPYDLDPGNTRALILSYLPTGLVNVTFFFYHYKYKTVLHSCIVCSLMLSAVMVQKF